MAGLTTQTNCIEKDLQAATADLYRVNFWSGLLRFGALGLIFFSAMFGAWRSPGEISFWLWTAAAAIAYPFWLICTHDAIHHTLLGWPALEEGLSRLISWPMFWPVGVYAELHRLHHGWNGVDLRDPERVQWTLTEYRAAPFWRQWYIRHQWLIDVFVLGGVGLILSTFWHGWQLRSLSSRLKLQILLDVGGIVLAQLCLLSILLATHQSLVRYCLFWLVLERTIGVVIQTRGHLEHYGLWHKSTGHRLTQLYACRNLTVSPFVTWLVGGLNYHAVHHAFPGIPFDQLAIAHQRVQTLLAKYDMPPLAVEQDYCRTTLKLFGHVRLIPE